MPRPDGETMRPRDEPISDDEVMANSGISIPTWTVSGVHLPAEERCLQAGDWRIR